MSCKYKLN